MESEGKIVEPMLGVGDRIGGYTIERLLGKGGMGAVYLVHGSDGRRFALKVMKPDDGDHGRQKIRNDNVKPRAAVPAALGTFCCSVFYASLALSISTLSLLCRAYSAILSSAL